MGYLQMEERHISLVGTLMDKTKTIQTIWLSPMPMKNLIKEQQCELVIECHP